MLLLALFACKSPADAMPPTPGGTANARGEGPKGPPPGEGGAPYSQNAHPNTAAMNVSFVPPNGRLPGATEVAPGGLRILGATSKDGVHFTPTNRVISDQANVPDLVTDSKGTLFLYYTSARLAGSENVLAAAKSTDGGQTWVHHIATVSGAQPPMVDPDVHLLPDGTFRLYYTGGAEKNPTISYAEGKDGLSFVAKGVAFAPPEGALDSNVFRVGGTWHLYAFDIKGNPVHHATSPDGTRFTPTSQPGQVKRDIIASNGVATPAGVRMFAFNRRDGISAWTSSDGASWKEDTAVTFPRGSRALEGEFVKDAAATQLRDGTWFAVYVTPIP